MKKPTIKQWYQSFDATQQHMELKSIAINQLRQRPTVNNYSHSVLIHHTQQHVTKYTPPRSWVLVTQTLTQLVCTGWNKICRSAHELLPKFTSSISGVFTNLKGRGHPSLIHTLLSSPFLPSPNRIWCILVSKNPTCGSNNNFSGFPLGATSLRLHFGHTWDFLQFKVGWGWGMSQVGQW